MIHYEVGWNQIGFIFQLKGSVFPFAFTVAMPCALLSMALKVMDGKDLLGDWSTDDYGRDGLQLLAESAAYGGFSFLVGFVIVFRTSQSYTRFNDALNTTHQMVAEWFDAAGSLVAFSKSSKLCAQDTAAFLHMVIRLFSMLCAASMEELTDEKIRKDLCFEILDMTGVDKETIQAITGKKNKVILIYQWIQQTMVHNMETGVLSVPPPVMSTAFRELAQGMVKFHDAMKIAKVPFPFPYAQTTVTLLLMHWTLTPIVMVQWTRNAFAAAVFTFVQVFILWSLNAIATGIEKPFGGQANDIDPYIMQQKMNAHLLLLLDPKTMRTPTLAPGTTCDVGHLVKKLATDRRECQRAAAEAKGSWVSRFRRRWASWHESPRKTHDETLPMVDALHLPTRPSITGVSVVGSDAHSAECSSPTDIEDARREQSIHKVSEPSRLTIIVGGNHGESRSSIAARVSTSAVGGAAGSADDDDAPLRANPAPPPPTNIPRSTSAAVGVVEVAAAAALTPVSVLADTTPVEPFEGCCSDEDETISKKLSDVDILLAEGLSSPELVAEVLPGVPTQSKAEVVRNLERSIGASLTCSSWTSGAGAAGKPPAAAESTDLLPKRLSEVLTPPPVVTVPPPEAMLPDAEVSATCTVAEAIYNPGGAEARPHSSSGPSRPSSSSSQRVGFPRPSRQDDVEEDLGLSASWLAVADAAVAAVVRGVANPERPPPPSEVDGLGTVLPPPLHDSPPLVFIEEDTATLSSAAAAAAATNFRRPSLSGAAAANQGPDEHDSAMAMTIDRDDSMVTLIVASTANATKADAGSDERGDDMEACMTISGLHARGSDERGVYTEAGTTIDVTTSTATLSPTLPLAVARPAAVSDAWEVCPEASATIETTTDAAPTTAALTSAVAATAGEAPADLDEPGHGKQAGGSTEAAKPTTTTTAAVASAAAAAAAGAAAAADPGKVMDSAQLAVVAAAAAAAATAIAAASESCPVPPGADEAKVGAITAATASGDAAGGVAAASSSSAAAITAPAPATATAPTVAAEDEGLKGLSSGSLADAVTMMETAKRMMQAASRPSVSLTGMVRSASKEVLGTSRQQAESDDTKCELVDVAGGDVLSPGSLHRSGAVMIATPEPMDAIQKDCTVVTFEEPPADGAGAAADKRADAGADDIPDIKTSISTDLLGGAGFLPF